MDLDKFPESTWMSLMAASYKLALELFEDPAIEAEYQIWLAKRNSVKLAAT